jgi:hypothetical protein
MMDIREQIGELEMDNCLTDIEIKHNESKTVWGFKVIYGAGKLIGQGSGFSTGIMAERAAKQFVKWYVEDEFPERILTATPGPIKWFPLDKP